MADRRDRIRIHIEGKEYSVVGGKFQNMLAAVKQINGRRFVGELKVWQLPGKLDEVRDQIESSGFQLEGGTAITAEPAAGQPARPSSTGDRIRIKIGPHQLTVVGGSFQDMLAAVKTLPGRRFDQEARMWDIPGDVGVIKGMVEAAGFELEGAENISAGPVSAMEPPDFGDVLPPPAYEPPDFADEDSAPPYEPPDWWDDMPPPSFQDEEMFDAFEPPDMEPSPFEPASPVSPSRDIGTSTGGDRIRLRLGDLNLVMTGGSFQEMLTAVKNIPGRRFNSAEKIWEIPGDITLDSVQQSISAAGFVIMEDQ